MRIVVPVSAGGSTDRIARLLAEKLGTAWRRPVIVENVTGAGGSIGATQVARANPDGYTLLLHSDAVVLNLALLKRPPYSLDDFSGVVRAVVNPQILVVRPTLGVKTSYRSPVLPDVPTVAESGISGFDVESWQGLLAPAATPRLIIDKINRDVLAILASPEIRKQIESMGYGVTSSTPQEFHALLRAELRRYTQVIKTAGITLK